MVFIYYTINPGAIVPNPASLPSNYTNNNGNPPYNTNPTSVVTATSAKMYKLNGATADSTGLGFTLRVMSGDTVSIYGKSFWHSSGTTANNHNPTAIDLLITLASTSAIVAADKGATAGVLTGSSTIPTDVNSFLSSAPDVTGRPKAYINWILFDEQFKVVTGCSGFDPVNTSADALKTHSLSVDVTRNGYLYVWVSNASNQDVFFDNLQVIHTRGPLVEETHYYPFGLTMAGISSKAAGKLENRMKFNEGTERTTDLDLNWDETDFRSYDAQIGRFHQIDPLADFSEYESPYSYAENNPISFNDPYGLESLPSIPTPKKPEPTVPTGQPKPKINPPPSQLPARVSPLPVAPPPPQVPMTPAPSPVPEPSPLPAVEVIGTGALGTAGLTILGVLLPLKAGADFPNGDETYYYKHPYERPSVATPFGGNGNNRENSNPHIVYEFSFTPKASDSRTPVLKYGISDEFRNGLRRPESQIASLMARYGASVKYKVLRRTRNRQQALTIEQELVNLHQQTYKEMPREQARSFPF